jgi:hypothetical protein
VPPQAPATQTLQHSWSCYFRAFETDLSSDHNRSERRTGVDLTKALKFFAVTLMLTSLDFAGQHVPLPPALMAAKTLYIENNSHNAKVADRCYDELTK